MSEPLSSAKTFVAIWVALLILTATTVGVSYINLGSFSAVVALVIATIKALLVVLFFMEVRYSPKMTKMVVVAGVLWLMILLLLSMTDYASRAWSGGV